MEDWSAILAKYGQTFQSITSILQFDIKSVKTYLRLNESKAGHNWTGWYIYYLITAHDGIYRTLAKHQNKTTAGYITALIISAIKKKDYHNNKYKGYRKYEEYYAKNKVKTIHIIIKETNETYRIQIKF